MPKKRKIFVKIIFSIISLCLIYILLQNLSFNDVKKSLKTLANGNTLLLYVLLYLVALLARSERFLIIYNEKNGTISLRKRYLILIATSLRNIGMNFAPLRLAELVIPTFLKISGGFLITSTIHPIWISSIFDLAALAVIGLSLLSLASFYELNTPIQIFSLNMSFVFFISIFLILILTTFLITIITKFLKSSYLTNSNLLILKKLKITELSNYLPNLNYSLTFRIFLLSIIIRLSKYLALASLFLHLSEQMYPSIKNILIIFSSFVGSEFVSSFPGSGVLGFGGYEITFRAIINTLSSEIVCNLSQITSVHLVGLSVELIIGIITIPLLLLLSKFIKEDKSIVP